MTPVNCSILASAVIDAVVCGSDTDVSDTATNAESVCDLETYTYCAGCIGCVGEKGTVTSSAVLLEVTCV